MTPARCRDTLPVMGIKSVVRLPRRWLDAAGIALVTGLAVAGAYVEANPVHRYGGLHLASHPPLAAYLLLAVPSVALIWRNSRPVEVLGLAVGGAVGWAALGQIDGAALVPVIVGVYWVALTRAAAHRSCRRARGGGGYLRDRGAAGTVRLVRRPERHDVAGAARRRRGRGVRGGAPPVAGR